MTSPPWAGDVAIERIFDAIAETGGTARLVGGCVRDWLAGREIKDLDLATDLKPRETTAALKKAGIRVVPTGLDHGTVSALTDGRSFEITTLRHDIETDGRRAKVGFTNDWAEDARRRDFTVNAMYADFDGTVHDPTGSGRSDLDARLLRFVGEPAERIQEDYLRILRFHRFASETGFALDQSGVDACARHTGGLARLSVERIWQEMRKLLAGPFRWPVLRHMAGDGTLRAILPEATIDMWQERLPSGDAVLMLAALVGRSAPEVADRWKLSRSDAARLEAATTADGGESTLSSEQLRRLAWFAGVQTVVDRLQLDAARQDLDAAGATADLLAWSPPALPVKGQDAIDLGVPKGPQVGNFLRAVELWWVDHDFAPDRSACLLELEKLSRLC